MPLRLLNLNVWHGRLPRVGALWLQSIEPTGQSERRYDALIEGLRHYAPDVIFLQECAPQPAYTRRLADDLGGFDAVSAIANAGVRWRGKGLPVGLGTGEGVSILARPGLKLRPFSKRPWILSNGGVATERHSFHLAERRIALAALVTPPGQGDVGLVCTHLRYAFPNLNTVFKTWTRLRGSGDVHGPPPRRLLNGVVARMRQRDLELEKLGQSLSRLHAAVGLGRMIVGGDFNLDADAAALVEWARANRLKNACIAFNGAPIQTWNPAQNPNTRFSTSRRHPTGELKRGAALLYAALDERPQSPDHVFVGHAFDVLNVAPAFDSPWQGSMSGCPPLMASDHGGLRVTLQ